MARKTKPCEFCENDSMSNQTGEARGHQLAVEVYPMNNIIFISSFADTESGECEELENIIHMNYCPVCGRKLGY